MTKEALTKSRMMLVPWSNRLSVPAFSFYLCLQPYDRKVIMHLEVICLLHIETYNISKSAPSILYLQLSLL